MSSRRRRSRRSSSSLLPKFLVFLFGAAIIAVIAGSFWLNYSRMEIDEATLCPATEPDRAWLILIDTTDGVTPVQRASLENQIQNLQRNMRSGDRVEVYEIRPDKDLLTPLTVVCHPGRPEDANPLISDPVAAREKFEERFKSPIDSTVDALLHSGPADSSPIMAAVQAAVVRGFGALPPETDKRLVIVSDLMEYGSGGSHYQGIPDFDSFKETDRFASLRADMRGVGVEIWYLRRDDAKAVQGRDHIYFWDSYLAAQGARVERVFAVEG